MKRAARAEKAYKNLDFLTGPDARPIRILSEFLEPLSRFRRGKVRDTIVLFGSSKAVPTQVVRRDLRELRNKVKQGRLSAERQRAIRERLDYRMRLARYYDDALDLAKRLTLWAHTLKEGNRFSIVSGGGPGIMEAGNLGAVRGGGISVGLNISLAVDQASNPYISDGYNFEFHYFFMRKFWFLFLARAIVIFPGGLGTMDELFEMLTLRQTRKVAKPLPIVLYGTAYWDRIIHFDEMLRWGTIEPADLELFHRSDSVDDAFAYLQAELFK